MHIANVLQRYAIRIEVIIIMDEMHLDEQNIHMHLNKRCQRMQKAIENR